MGEEGRVSSLLSFLLSFMYFIPLVGFSLEVSVVLLTLVEDLSVVLYDLSHLDLQLQCFGFVIGAVHRAVHVCHRPPRVGG